MNLALHGGLVVCFLRSGGRNAECSRVTCNLQVRLHWQHVTEIRSV